MNNDHQEYIMLLRSLKKSAIILLLLMKYGKPLTALEAGRLLEINKETAAGYMRSLETIGLVQHLGRFRGFCMTQKAVQLILPSDYKSGDSPIIPTTSSSSLINDVVIIKDKKLVVDEKRENPSFIENKNLLASCGIGEPSLSKLANLDYVNPEYIMDHVAKWRKEKQQPALLIFRIKSGEKAPRDPNRTLSVVEREKYTNW